MKRSSLIPRLLLAATAAALALPVAAERSGMRPGQWEYTMKMDMPGMPMQMPPQVYKHCLSQADIDKGEQYRSQDQDECQLKNLKQTASSASYDIACKDGTTGHYDFTTAGETMTGKGVMNTQGMQMTTHFSARRLGECSK